MYTTQLSTTQEQAWLTTRQDDQPFGLYTEGENYWLMLQPQLFFSQRKRWLNGQVIIGRMERTRDHTVISLGGLRGIEHLGVSRLHVALLPMEHGVGLEDLKSTNGTRLNNLPLIPGRSYKLSHGDMLELGQVRLHVHVLEMDAFLKGIRELIVKRFDLSVQNELIGMVAPSETLLVLQQRLSNRVNEQLQVLLTFKDQREPLTLDKLHERINRVLGTSGGFSSPDKQEMEGDKTFVPAPRPTVRFEDANGIPTNKHYTDQLLAEVNTLKAQEAAPAIPSPAPPKPKDKPLESSQYLSLCEELHQAGVAMESQLQGFLAQAQRLENHAERQMAMNLLIPILSQMNIWLPTVKQD